MPLCFRLPRRLVTGFCVLALAALMPGGAKPEGAPTPSPRAGPGAPPPILPAPNPPDAANSAQPEKQDKRVFGVFPNYRTTDGNVPFQEITGKQKFLIGFKDSFDWPVYPVGGLFAALYQLENQNPSFGQGMK